MKKKERPEEYKVVGINMRNDMAHDLETRAESMHLPTGKYCRLILAQWLDSGGKLKLQEK